MSVSIHTGVTYKYLMRAAQGLGSLLAGRALITQGSNTGIVGPVPNNDHGVCPVVYGLKSNPPENKSLPQQNPNMPRTLGVKRKRKSGKKNNKLLTVGAAKRMLQGVLEKKQLIIYPQITAIAQASVYTYNLTAQLTQGTADGNRIGDSVDIRNLEFNLQWLTAPQGAYYRLRVLVFWSGEEYNPGASNFGSASLGINQLFIGSATFATQNIVNSKSINIIYDQLAEINSAVPAYEDGMSLRANITSGLAGKFLYQEAGSVYGKTKNLYMVVIGNWSTTNATAPANVGSCYVTSVLRYTDA